MNELLQFDQELFFAINQGWASPLLDVVAPWLRNMFFWAPFYLFLGSWYVVRFGTKGWLVVLAVLLTFAVSDMLSSSVIKPLVERLRPCNEPELAEYVRLLVGCGGGFSFTSSHATNHFAFALFNGLVLFRFWKPALPYLLVWASAISLSQVYVGVHYPLDILGGAILGSSIGLVGALLFHRLVVLEK